MSKKKRLRDAVLTYCHTKEHKESLKTNNPGGIKTSKPIYQIDLNGNVIMEWKSAREAARKTNISFGNISSGATSHKNWKPGGFFWRFTSDPSITNKKLNIT